MVSQSSSDHKAKFQIHTTSEFHPITFIIIQTFVLSLSLSPYIFMLASHDQDTISSSYAQSFMYRLNPSQVFLILQFRKAIEVGSEFKKRLALHQLKYKFSPEFRKAKKMFFNLIQILKQPFNNFIQIPKQPTFLTN